jgi:ABC-type branched-subunit amino acid transport system substrate-binding protein
VDPYAPRRSSQEQTKLQAVSPNRGDAIDPADDDMPLGLRRGRPSPPPLVGPPPTPRVEARPAFITARELVLIAVVSIVSALVVVGVYRFANKDAAPAAAPQLAANTARTVEPMPPPATFDEPTSPAAPAAPAPTTAAAAPAPSIAPAPPPAPVTAPPPAPQTLAAAAPAAPAPAPSSVLPTGPAVRGVTDSEIRFGIAAPLSGPAKELGRQMKLGLDTAFGAINEAGGVQGRQLRLAAVDDGYEPSRTLDAMKHLVDRDAIFGVVGNVGTPTAAVALPYTLQQRMLFFGAFTGSGILRRDPPDRYVFNYRASYAEETDATVQYLVKIRRLKPEQIAVFAQQDAYGDSGFAGVVKAVRALNGDPNKILRLNYKRNTVDVDAAVAALRAHKTPIKAVVMVPTYRAAAKFIEKTRETYPGLIYTNVSFVGSSALADELMLLGPRYAEGVIVTQVVPALEGYSSFVLEYKRALAKQFPGEAPDYVSLEGFVVGKLLAEGLRRTGPQVDTEKLVDALETLRNFDVGLGTQLTFGRTEHQASHKIWGTQLNAEGRYQPFELQ